MNSKLGQHFLTSKSIAKEMVDLADSTNCKTVLEIGPGKGILTEYILSKKLNVIAIEKDVKYFDLLGEKFKSEIKTKQLNLVNDDIRNTNLEMDADYIVIANIPYYITSSLIRQLLSTKNKPKKIILLVQKEIAQRITNKTKESILSLSVKYYSDVKLHKIVSARYFSPMPRVDSAILIIENIQQRNREEEELFFYLIKNAFASKRKTLGNNLKSVELNSNLLKLDMLDKTKRAEDIPLSDWVRTIRMSRVY